MKKNRRFGPISRVLRWASPLHLPRTKLTTKPYGSVDTYLTRVQPLALLKAIFGPQTAPLTREWPQPYHPSGCGGRSRWDSSLQLQSSCWPDSCGPKPVLAHWPRQTRDFNCLPPLPPLPPTFVHWKNNNITTWVSHLNFDTGPQQTLYNKKKVIKRQGTNIPLSTSISVFGDLWFVKSKDLSLVMCVLCMHMHIGGRIHGPYIG